MISVKIRNDKRFKFVASVFFRNVSISGDKSDHCVSADIGVGQLCLTYFRSCIRRSDVWRFVVTYLFS
jgi:hypothetical protein